MVGGQTEFLQYPVNQPLRYFCCSFFSFVRSLFDHVHVLHHSTHIRYLERALFREYSLFCISMFTLQNAEVNGPDRNVHHSFIYVTLLFFFLSFFSALLVFVWKSPACLWSGPCVSSKYATVFTEIVHGQHIHSLDWVEHEKKFYSLEARIDMVVWHIVLGKCYRNHLAETVIYRFFQSVDTY